MYKAPLHICVIWHPKYPSGRRFANAIYSQFTRDIDKPLSRGIGIPVFFRSENFNEDFPRQIVYKEAERNAVIFLVDNYAIAEWQEYARKIQEEINEAGDGNILIPVSTSPHFGNLGAFKETNFLRVHQKNSFAEMLEVVLRDVTHELCRLIYGKARLSDLGTEMSNAPINLFISHAKLDGVNIAKDLLAYVNSNLEINTFFDEINIAPGSRWKRELAANDESSALLVVQTDAYSSREWCRWEVLHAKKSNQPVIVINAIQEGEERSFPYLGNVPTIRWKKGKGKSKRMQAILNFTLFEILRFKYTHMFLASRHGLKGLAGTHKPKILASPPELLTLLGKALESETKGSLVLYPDPPLTIDETELLSDTTEEFEFLTPTMLDAYSQIVKS